jgi:hypothetical protein
METKIMSRENSAPPAGTIETPAAAGSASAAPVSIAICCLAMILALVLGVGLASHEVLRHIVQTLPLWVGVVLGFRHSRAVSWAALPLFLFWLPLMALIWAYLLGVSNVLSGHFSPVEVAMTIIVGAASIVGIVSFIRSQSSLTPLYRVALFVALAAVQVLCLRVSFLPAIAHR